MTAWAATSVYQQWPELKITWAVEARCRPVLDVGRSVHTTADYQRERWKGKRLRPSSMLEQIRYYLGFRSCRFEWGIDFQGHSKTALCLRLSGAKKRLAVRFTDPISRRMNPLFRDPADSPHVIDVNHAALQSFAPCPLTQRPLLPGDAANVMGNDGRLITIATSAGHASKVYPIESWNKVAYTLIRDGYRVAALGGPSDPLLAVEGVENLVGKLSLSETLNWVRGSRLHLAADTGTGHMAAATGVAVVSLFAATDPAVFRPYGHRVKVLTASNMSDIPPSEVLEAVTMLMSEPSDRIS